jgi:hypothetical protein
MKPRERRGNRFARLAWPIRGVILSGIMVGLCGLVAGIGIATGRVSSDTSGLGPGILGVVAVAFGASWFARHRL